MECTVCDKLISLPVTAGEDFSLAGLPKAAELRANLKDVLFADLVKSLVFLFHFVC